MNSPIGKIAEHAIKSASSAQLGRFFAGRATENMAFQKVNLGGNYSEKLSTVNNFLEAFDAIDQLHLTNTVTGSIGSLKTVTKLLSSRNSREFIQMKMNSPFPKIVAKLQASIELLAENEIVDLLICIRKLEHHNTIPGFNYTDYDSIRKRVESFMQDKKFSPKQIILIYMNFFGMGWRTDNVTQVIRQMITEAPDTFTSMNLLSILYTGGLKPGNIKLHDMLLYDEACRLITPMLPELDINQKAELFRNVAKIEFQFNLPRLNTPPIVNILRIELKKNIDKLTETDVTMIFEAYRYLPWFSNQDLVEELRDMIQITLNHNSKNLKSSFLMDYLRTQISNPYKNLSKQALESINLVFTHVGGRLETDLILRKHAQELIEIASELGINSTSFNNGLLKMLSIYPDYADKNFPIFEFLLQKGVNVASQMKSLTSSKTFQLWQVSKLHRLKVALKNSIPENYGDSEVFERVANHPNANGPEILNSYAIDGLFNYLDSEGALKVAEITLEVKYNSGLKANTFKELLKCMVNIKTTNQILENYRGRFQNLLTKEINWLLDAFNLIDISTTSQSLFLISVLEMNVERINTNDIISFLNSRRNYLSDLGLRNEWLAARMIDILGKLENLHNYIRTDTLFSLVYRYYENGLESTKLLNILQDNFDWHLTKDNMKTNPMILDHRVLEFLIDHNSLKVQTALKYLDRISGTIPQKHSSKYIGFMLTNCVEHLTEDNKIMLENIGKQLVDQNCNSLTDHKFREVTESLTNLLSFPIKLIEPKIQLIIETLRKYISAYNTRTLIQMMRIISSKDVMGNYIPYLPILRELGNIFNNLCTNMKSFELIECLKTFATLGFRSSSVLNKFLIEIRRVYSTLKRQELLSLIESFSTLNIKQSDLFDTAIRTLLKPEKELSHYDADILLKSLFKVGYDSDFICSNIKKLISSKLSNPINIINAIKFVLSLEVKEEEEILDLIFSRAGDNDFSDRKAKGTAQYYQPIHYLLKTKYPSKSYANLWEQIHCQNTMQKERSLVYSTTLVASYLDAMGVNHDPNFSTNGITLISIPSQKVYLICIRRNDINYDKHTLRGGSKLVIRCIQLQAVKENKTMLTLFHPEFLELPNHLQRVQFISNLGIKALVTSSYDFSKISKNGNFDSSVEKEEIITDQSESTSETTPDEEVDTDEPKEAKI